jgi:hypothetical protein
MKKSLFLLFASFSFAAANAQIKNDKGTFTKPSAGEYAIETLGTPNVTGGAWFALNPVGLAGLTTTGFAPAPVAVAPVGGTLKLRKFSSDKKAQRATVSLSIGNNTAKPVVGSNNTTTSIGLVASYGQEKHFAGAERLSTYIGWDAMLGIYSLSNTNAGIKSSQTNFGIGGQVVSGFDYYVLPKIYLGAELSYGLGIISAGATNVGAGKTSNGGSAISLQPNLGAILRLGYRL